MSDRKRNNPLHDPLAYAKATLEIEGRRLTPEGEELILRRIRGEITHDEFLRLARELAESQAKKGNGVFTWDELQKVCEQATRIAREEAFAAGAFVSRFENGKLLREYPDGTIKEVIYDQSGNPDEFDYTLEDGGQVNDECH